MSMSLSPRGGKGLIERISRDARVPVIKHLDGNCHTFIDSDADAEIAIKVSVNAKPIATVRVIPWRRY